MSGRRVPAEISLKRKEEAFRLFCDRVPFPQICQQVSISGSLLSKWRTEEDWLARREAHERSLLEDQFGAGRLTASKLRNTTMEQLTRGLDHLKNRPTPLTVTEMEKLSVILGNLDRIVRLDANKSTENVNVQAQVAVKYTADKIREIVMNDAFTKETPDA